MKGLNSYNHKDLEGRAADEIFEVMEVFVVAGDLLRRELAGHITMSKGHAMTDAGTDEGITTLEAPADGIPPKVQSWDRLPVIIDCLKPFIDKNAAHNYQGHCGFGGPFRIIRWLVYSR